jgi:hypothetical protein
MNINEADDLLKSIYGDSQSIGHIVRPAKCPLGLIDLDKDTMVTCQLEYDHEGECAWGEEMEAEY